MRRRNVDQEIRLHNIPAHFHIVAMLRRFAKVYQLLRILRVMAKTTLPEFRDQIPPNDRCELLR